jgi:hypothetical protein
MDNTDRIREMLSEIRDAEQRLARLRAELARMVEGKLGASLVRRELKRGYTNEPYTGQLTSSYLF